jgi:hypothetical protein
MRSRIEQFIFSAIAIKNADSGHTVISCPDHVVTPVTDHGRVRGINTAGSKGVSQKFCFVGSLAIQFRTKYLIKSNARC